ncbi:unnamed protein product [Pleuronectes platessa]|uniref:Uncharacterized protein n=1 Tax=Pleuronectes platessa TaxID=8262 RepID=A0A9N7TQL3_PLEPL|nr:unnamed protein product [Pleuronectes platessa]
MESIDNQQMNLVKRNLVGVMTREETSENIRKDVEEAVMGFLCRMVKEPDERKPESDHLWDFLKIQHSLMSDHDLATGCLFVFAMLTWKATIIHLPTRCHKEKSVPVHPLHHDTRTPLVFDKAPRSSSPPSPRLHLAAGYQSGICRVLVSESQSEGDGSAASETEECGFLSSSPGKYKAGEFQKKGNPLGFHSSFTLVLHSTSPTSGAA